MEHTQISHEEMGEAGTKTGFQKKEHQFVVSVFVVPADYKSSSMYVFWVCVLLAEKCECVCDMALIIFENFLPYEVNFNYSYIRFRFLSASPPSPLDKNAGAVATMNSMYDLWYLIYCNI